MTPFALRDTDALLRRVRNAGFGDVRGEWVDVDYVFPTPAVFVAFRRDRAAEIASRIAHVPETGREAAWAAVAEAAKEFVGPDGAVRMRNRAYCVVAQR
jgi:hypothetical protein